MKVHNTLAAGSGGSSPPRRPGRYEVRERVGQGGRGTVWRAWDPLLCRDVALKRLDGSWSEDERLAFLHEARVAGGLEHPAIMPIYDADVDADGALFYVMRLVRGGTFRAALNEPLPLVRALGVLVRVCDAVAYAHDRGQVHGDLKPENVMIGGFGEVLVLDWGLGALGGRGAGTPAYMAPEQWAGECGPGSDVWAIGTMLEEVLGGQSVGELTGIVAASKSLAVQDRPGAGAIGSGLRAWLDGDATRREAAEHTERALTAEAASAALETTIAARQAEADALRARLPPWAALSEKRPLIELRSEIAGLLQERDRRAIEALSLAERALQLDGTHGSARAVLARAWWRRFEEADGRGDTREAAFSADRVRAYGDVALTARLAALGRVVVTTDRPSRARARRWDTTPLIWTLNEPVELGPTPCDVPLEAGSWMIEIDADVPTQVSVVVRREVCTVLGPIVLPARAPPGCVYVPAGPARIGGDPGAGEQLPPGERDVEGFFLSKYPVTVAEYLEFIQALPEVEARARAPRRHRGADLVPYWALEDGVWRIPEVDIEGDRWSPRFPIFAVSWHDAVAYCGWRARRDGTPWRLPTEVEWEKAARGADGRIFPWGSEFEAALCHMCQSRPGRPQPAEVGAAAGDVGPFGVRDMAGGVREWCGDEASPGSRDRRPVRGGCWNGSARLARAANRFAYDAEIADGNIGFRLACSLT